MEETVAPTGEYGLIFKWLPVCKLSIKCKWVKPVFTHIIYFPHAAFVG